MASGLLPVEHTDEWVFRAHARWNQGDKITATSEKISIEGHVGTWCVIDSGEFVEETGIRQTMYLLEHETYGDEAANLIVDDEGNIIIEDSYSGLDDDMEDAGWERVTE